MHPGNRILPLRHISPNQRPQKVVNFHHFRYSGDTIWGCLHFAIPNFHSATTTMNRSHIIFAAIAASMAAFAATLVTKKDIEKPRRKYRSRNTPKYKRPALLRTFHVNTYLQTPWNVILSRGADDDFLVSLNFTKTLVLDTLLPLFDIERQSCNYGSPYRKGPKTRGRNPQLRSVDLLAMSLSNVKTKSTMFSLCPVFGIVPSSIGVWMDYSLQVLCRVVKRKSRKDFEVRWPNIEEMRASAALLEQNRIHGRLLQGVFGITDGGRMPCADYTDLDLQNAHFEGFTQNVEVTNLFLWSFFGEIIQAAVNYPGSWQDTKLAGMSGLYFPKLSDEMPPPGMAILGDSAFVNTTKATNGKVLRSRKSNEVNDIPKSAELASVDLMLLWYKPQNNQGFIGRT